MIFSLFNNVEYGFFWSKWSTSCYSADLLRTDTDLNMFAGSYLV
jgi:hypothetical protein